MRLRAQKGLGLCSGCGAERDRGSQRYCKACHAAYMRANRPKFSEMPDDARARASARAYANEYQRRGKLVPKPCELCNSTDVQKHHDDYTKPLAVRWLCRDCHLDLHRSEKRGDVALLNAALAAGLAR